MPGTRWDFLNHDIYHYYSSLQQDLTQGDGSENTEEGGRLGGMMGNSVLQTSLEALWGQQPRGLHLSTSHRPPCPWQVLQKVRHSERNCDKPCDPGPQGPQACCSESDRPRKATAQSQRPKEGHSVNKARASSSSPCSPKGPGCQGQ